jgi:hypothetical protein
MYTPAIEPPFYDFHEPCDFFTTIREAVRLAENRLREHHGLPRVGEGWVSETALFRALHETFPDTQVLHHGRPEWLGRQHLDIWFPEWQIAVEFQGTQHFEPVERFGGTAGLARTRERDERKRALCKKYEVALVIVTEDDALGTVVENIQAIKLAHERESSSA